MHIFAVYELFTKQQNFRLVQITDDEINMTQKLKLVYGLVENAVGKGENAGYLAAFSPFFTVFSPRVVNSRDCVVKSFKCICEV